MRRDDLIRIRHMLDAAKEAILIQIECLFCR
jgi:hypothetical protein